jgi:N-methylhydantoinase B
MDAIELTLFVKRINAICEEMGGILMRTAVSPNIKDRRDFSCAIFDANGQLCGQAAHIPVHLGSMAYAMSDIISTINWRSGDMVILNDPYLGGTHLPDVTVIAPVFDNETLCAFVTNRAHHADIGASTPGSMPLSRTLQEEGLVIPPTHIMRASKICMDKFSELLNKLHNPHLARADFIAQISANQAGLQRLSDLILKMSSTVFIDALGKLNDYAELLARSVLDELPGGYYEFTDFMDDDGQELTDIPIKASISINRRNIQIDFAGTAAQVSGNINCPLSVTAAAVYYCFYCLMPPETPASAGAFRGITINAPPGCLVNASYPAAVTAGNVETSTRIVDVLLGALANILPEKIPAASHGSMNNVAMGAADWDYYETLGGGMGANPSSRGLDAVQTHMTNTLNTPIEILEKYYPLRINQYAVRRNSGGQGKHRGGHGLIRQFEFLKDCHVTVLTERRKYKPWGIAGGQPGMCGINLLNNKPISGKADFRAKPGDQLTVLTAGGGGWGEPR